MYFRPIIILGTVVCVFAVIVFFTWFRWNEVIDLSLDVEWTENILVIKGKTNLSDKAVLSYEIAPANEIILAEEGIYASGIIIVKKKQYFVQLDTSLFPPGKIKIWVRFQPKSTEGIQPLGIEKKYGEYGQYLKGAHVIKENDHYRLEVSKVVPDHTK